MGTGGDGGRSSRGASWASAPLPGSRDRRAAAHSRGSPIVSEFKLLAAAVGSVPVFLASGRSRRSGSRIRGVIQAGAGSAGLEGKGRAEAKRRGLRQGDGRDGAERGG